ncbi:AAA family ATPase [Desulfovibrio psychrotolerans]|uniref:ATPase dynein-related AAA domain-containing protein n=1 Tax=Desulfovibrio psychrotolerans TaxID=415242 RepID=A0A7J0BRX0_9BACT|nr:AAA family ATPase [Desulfovibrio psychrotolerans]GFM35971.1 hypothetical protein DSM19430T_06550 [Desulfovibrio psychrotolerans]
MSIYLPAGLLQSIGKAEFVHAFETFINKGKVTAADIIANATVDNRNVSESSAQTKASVFNKIIKNNWQAQALKDCFINKSNPQSEIKAKELFNHHFSDQIYTTQYQLWDDFLKEWPMDRLKDMSYEQYSKAGSQDTFCYWIESKTEDLGSILGGSSFKFGVFSRKATDTKESKSGYTYTDTDAWMTILGNSAEEAFNNVKKSILKIIGYVQSDQLHEIETIPFWNVFKWKIAFLYQPRNTIRVVNIFKMEALQSYLGEKSRSSMSELHQRVINENPDVDVFELGRRIWSHYTDPQATSDDYSMPKTPRNIILYGPPGTGKTYSLQHGEIEELSLLKDLPSEQVKFVTFHPSYSYEDFIEGICPVLDDDSGQLRYTNKPGALKEISSRAKADSIQLDSGITINGVNKWKMSLGDTSTIDGNLVFETCMQEGIALFGFVDADLSNFISSSQELEKKLADLGVENKHIVAMMRQFTVEMKKGDIILVSKGNFGGIRAIGQVLGNYEYNNDLPGIYGFSDAYTHTRTVQWVWHDNTNTIPSEILLKRGVSQRTIYSINKSIKEDELVNVLGARRNKKPKNYVLKIDEINRGNVAKIFGELITLIEDDKRGETITLPSGDPFSVPDNLFIIGTMNTADRSLTHLDTALRRRFHFIEMPPRPDALRNQTIGTVDLTVLLERMNERMESLLGREHMLGHAYFMQDDDPISDGESFFRVIMNKILPQLQEYFFDDYEQIQKILGNKIVVKERLTTIPDRYTNREVFRIKRLKQQELLQAIAEEYGFIQNEGEDDA